MTSNKKPFIERIQQRILAKLEKTPGTHQDVLRYAVAVCRSIPREQAEKIISICPQPLRFYIESELYRINAQKHETAQRIVQAKAREDAEHQKVRDLLLRDLDAARRAGCADAFLAGLAPQERDSIATKDERRQALDLRKSALKSTAVKQILDCTDTQLSRWSLDGRLPVLFRRIRPTDFGSLSVRHWSPSVVEQAKPHVALWREEDAQVARANRSKAVKRSS